MTLARILRWRPLEGSGLEQARVRRWDDHIRIRGAVIGDAEGGPFSLFYEIALDTDWTFSSLLVQTDTGVMEALTRDKDGHWRDMREDRPELEGCVDIDLSGSPLTNTLPIRRITDWTLGEKRRFEMAYVALPNLTVNRDGQVYTRIAQDRFLYESADGSFSAEIEVDGDGFVTRYPPLFERIG